MRERSPFSALASQAAIMNEDIIRRQISKFKWYQPIEFGHGISAVSVLGSYTSESPEWGIKKWQYIIERNLPDIQGMRVLDLGCNSGLYCVQLARMGAREVVGLDSETTWPSWKQQALFVKEALEWRCRTSYNITFIDAPMTSIAKLNLGSFDLVLGLCCIYYLSSAEINQLLSHFHATGTTTIVLQGNVNRADQSREVHNRAVPKFLVSALKKAGFSYVEVDAPFFYSRPVVVGRKRPYERSTQSKRDRLRDWMRSLV
jgi:SAM-dependent methyltransferase